MDDKNVWLCLVIFCLIIDTGGPFFQQLCHRIKDFGGVQDSYVKKG